MWWMWNVINGLLGLLVIAHLAFFVMEFCWLKLPDFRARLGFTGVDQTEVAIVGKNQAFSNLFLSAGVAFGWYWLWTDKPAAQEILIFFLACIAVAGVVGFLTIPKSKGAFLAFQCGPSLLALVCLSYAPLV